MTGPLERRMHQDLRTELRATERALIGAVWSMAERGQTTEGQRDYLTRLIESAVAMDGATFAAEVEAAYEAAPDYRLRRSG